MRKFTVLVAIVSGVPAVAHAQSQADYPAKPIRIMIGTAAGGGSDLMARLIGQQFTQAWGQQVIVEPRPGAGGNIAAEQVAKSPPDGYTLYVCFGTHTVNPNLYAKAGYDALRDFAPVTLLARQYNALVVHPSLPVRSVNELVALARKNPGKLSYASSGSGSPTHLGMELFKINAQIDMTHIPYKGAAPSRIDLLGGHVDVMFDVLRTALPYRDAGRTRILAVASPQRSTLAPDMPTMAEAGWKGIEVLTWHALLAPAGTPAAIVDKLQAEIQRGLLAPASKDKLAGDGVEVVASTPAELEAFMRSDMAKWGNVIKTARIRPD
ncbi:MAG TPA: tripartite tricarboxylate transporter substrate binding protein [Burkholderiales bacterium]|nr:tripartite tricarboxylate transporter substrate binding protein [Burkholderiales bacterium]